MDALPTKDAYIATEDGYFVSQKFMDLANVIQDYDPWLELRWIPPDKRRTVGDKLECYAIFDSSPTTDDKAIMYFKETDTPEEILVRLFHGDINKGEHPLQIIDAHVDAQKLLQNRRFLNELEDAEDEAKFLLGSPLNYVKMRNPKTGELLKLDDYRRRVIEE